MIHYRSLLQTAWHITIRKPWLWFFGLFAVLAFDYEVYDILIDGPDAVAIFQERIDELRELWVTGQLSEAWTNARVLLAENVLSSLLIALVVLIAAALVVWIIIVSQAALIAHAAWHREGKELDFSSTFLQGRQYLRPLFLITLYAKVFVYGLFVVIELPLAVTFIRSGNLSLTIFMAMIAFLLLIPLNIIVSFIARYAAAFVILEEKPVNEAIRLGWRLFVRHWLASLEMALLLFILNVLVSFALSVVIFLFAIPDTGIGGLAIQVMYGFLGAIIVTFQYAAWTLLFFELEEGRFVPKLVRWFAKGSLAKTAR